MGRSILAVVVGFVLIGALAFGTNALLLSAMPGAFDGSGRITDPALLYASQAWVGLFAIAGCYVCARLAPSHPLRHALILGALGLVFNVAGAMPTWDFYPKWYTIAGVGLTMVWAWIGGTIRERELVRSRAEAPIAPA